MPARTSSKSPKSSSTKNQKRRFRLGDEEEKIIMQEEQAEFRKVVEQQIAPIDIDNLSPLPECQNNRMYHIVDPESHPTEKLMMIMLQYQSFRSYNQYSEDERVQREQIKQQKASRFELMKRKRAIRREKRKIFKLRKEDNGKTIYFSSEHIIEKSSNVPSSGSSIASDDEESIYDKNDFSFLDEVDDYFTGYTSLEDVDNYLKSPLNMTFNYQDSFLTTQKNNQGSKSQGSKDPIPKMPNLNTVPIVVASLSSSFTHTTLSPYALIHYGPSIPFDKPAVSNLSTMPSYFPSTSKQAQIYNNQNQENNPIQSNVTSLAQSLDYGHQLLNLKERNVVLTTDYFGQSFQVKSIF
jgi:hypothetical protein